jgi:CheY-like chemotaxis protein
VLLSDISMPGEDGYWLIDQVRALPAEAGGVTPAIALTSHGSPQDGARVLRAGFQVHLTKPVVIRELVSTVAALDPRGSQSRNRRPMARS